MEIIIAVGSLCISAFTLGVLLSQYRNDKPKIEFSYDILCNDDHSKEWVRIYLINTGRRPILIKAVGVYDWSMGMYISRENKNVEKILNEAEMLHVDEHIRFKDQWRIGRLFAIDHTGKRWVSTKKQMRFLYELAHYDGVNKKFSEKIEKNINVMKRRSYKEYRKTIIKIGRKPKDMKT